MRCYHFIARENGHTGILTVSAMTLCEALDKWRSLEPESDIFQCFGEILAFKSAVCPNSRPMFPRFVPKLIDHPIYEIRP